MENIKLEIKPSDIKEYLKDLKKNHPDEYENYYRYKEAMFVKYMKEYPEIITKESLEILMKKYSFDEISVDGTYHYDDYGILKRQSLTRFNDYLYKINNLDISGICHILIPTLKYYGQDTISVNRLYTILDIVADRLVVSMDHPMSIIVNTLDDYRICGKVETNPNYFWIKMGREHCRRELLAYQDFYDENKVKRIKKIMREDLK